MMKNRKNIYSLELEEAKLIDTDILKEKLLKLFRGYIVSRSSPITIFFRNEGLTAKKMALAKESMQLIKNFEGDNQELLDELKLKRLENAELSRKYKKFHYNLLRPEGIKLLQVSTGGADARDCSGESTYKSDLADIFHKSIQMVKDSYLEKFDVRLKLN